MDTVTRGQRLHIGIFGRRNSGKSSFINALTGQDASIVSDTPGTTADPVYKNMEIHGVGACVLIDTAGYDDQGALGALRVEKTRLAAQKTDVAILLFSDPDIKQEKEWVDFFRAAKTPLLPVINKTDVRKDTAEIAKAVKALCGTEAIEVSAKEKTGFEKVRRHLRLFAPEEERTITGKVAGKGDHVLLVMPQDASAPRSRLILPQVQTIRELLDKDCVVTCVTPAGMQTALLEMKNAPNLIITDSQVFSDVYAMTPPGVKLTSFSILLADVKGDAEIFSEGAKTIDFLQEGDRVLIAEACTHAPQSEDIGRVKIPALLRKRAGEGLLIDVVSGEKFPAELSSYALIIHCGACMFNRKHVLSRIQKAVLAGVPITNYGMAIAKLTGILDKVYMPPKA